MVGLIAYGICETGDYFFNLSIEPASECAFFIIRCSVSCRLFFQLRIRSYVSCPNLLITSTHEDLDTIQDDSNGPNRSNLFTRLN